MSEQDDGHPPKPHGDVDYYFKLRRGEVAPRYKVKTPEEELADYNERMARGLPNRTFQKHNGKGVWVPNGMSVVELVEIAEEFEREFDVGKITATLMAEAALKVINRLRAGSASAETPQDQKPA